MGIGVAEETGLIQTFMKKKLVKVNPKIITFLLILIAVFSSIVNEVGYAVLIPLGALLFLFKGLFSLKLLFIEFDIFLVL